MLRVRTFLAPYRISTLDMQPITLNIEITNLGEKPELVSLEISSPEHISLDKTGFVRQLEKRLGTIPPKGTARFSVPLYPKPGIKKGRYKVLLKINRHYRDYDYVHGVVERTIEVRVV